MKSRIKKILLSGVLLILTLTMTSCLYAVQEGICKIKFKKKYKCPVKQIVVIEDEMDMVDLIKLRGCGRTVVYDGTKEYMDY